MAAVRTCGVCEAVNQFDLIELDGLMGDPTQWPVTVWGQFDPPAGELPPSFRRFGAIEVGLAWLHDRGHDISRGVVRRHYQYDVPKIATNPDDLVATGLIVRGHANANPAKVIDPLAYLRYYELGIDAGVKGLELLLQRIENLQKSGAEVPASLMKQAIDVGGKLAMSQAGIRAAGKPWGSGGDVDEGFRAGSAPAASERLGNHRIRTVDGEARPIVDRGPADREAYSERAAQEGGAGLPHR